jgi:hypothetical protein
MNQDILRMLLLGSENDTEKALIERYIFSKQEYIFAIAYSPTQSDYENRQINRLNRT